MGCYDTICGHCPKCGKKIVGVSKSGKCQLFEYNINKVPDNVYKDIEGNCFICECGKRWRFVREVYCQDKKNVKLILLEYDSVKVEEKWDRKFITELYFRYDGVIIHKNNNNFNQILGDVLGGMSELRVPVEIKIKNGEIRIKRIDDE